MGRVKTNATETQRQVRGAHQDEFSGTGVGGGVGRVGGEDISAVAERVMRYQLKPVIRAYGKQ